MDRPLEYDREGNPISLDRFCELCADREYKVVQQDHVDNWLVSTVWLGIDHDFTGKGPPIIFETMVFDQSQEGLQESAETMKKGAKAAEEMTGRKYPEPDPEKVPLGPEAFMDRYATEEEARKGHQVALLAARAGLISKTAGSLLDENEALEADRQSDV